MGRISATRDRWQAQTKAEKAIAALQQAERELRDRKRRERYLRRLSRAR